MRAPNAATADLAARGGNGVKHLIVKWSTGYCNLAVTDIKKDGDIVWAYINGEFVGMFDLASVDILYVSQEGGKA